jgi:quinol monooxygenase YgiN
VAKASFSCNFIGRATLNSYSSNLLLPFSPLWLKEADMNPLLSQIRGQLPNETVPFGLVFRAKVIEGKRAEYIEAARRAQAGTQKEPGNIFYRFFWDAQDPLQYVLLEAWQDFGALVAHFETTHFRQYGEEAQSFREGSPSFEVLLDL